MEQHKILIVEDEKNLGSTLMEYLQAQNYQVFWSQTKEDADKVFKKEEPNIILLDIGLPDGNGLELAKQWREIRKNFVFLFLSALNDPETKVEGLELGAQDYITKPFALKELTLRLEKIKELDQSLKTTSDEIVHGDLKILFNQYEVIDGEGKTIALSQKECAILKLLYEKSPEAVEREDIIQEVWGNNKFPSNRTIDNYIVKLRKWCETDKQSTINIQSIRGIGYKLIIKD